MFVLGFLLLVLVMLGSGVFCNEMVKALTGKIVFEKTCSMSSGAFKPFSPICNSLLLAKSYLQSPKHRGVNCQHTCLLCNNPSASAVFSAS